jgi:hypothetical protein
VRKYVIAVEGDNDELHQEWLTKAVETIERHVGGVVYRAWVERVTQSEVDEAAPLPPVR